MGTRPVAVAPRMDERPPPLPWLDEAIAELGTPAVAERCSPLTGTGVYVVDLSRGAVGCSAGEIARASARLRSLPCPTIGWGRPDGVDDALAAFAAAFDVMARSSDEMVAILDGIRAAPVAAMTLVQVLRLGAGLAIDEALLLESLAYGTLLVGAEHRRWLESRARPASRAVESEPAVLVTRDEGRLGLVLNRPRKRNAYSAATRDALVAGLEIAVADPSVAEVVITGRGESFCAGGDLDEFGTYPDVATAHAIRSTRSAARTLASCADRVRVEVQGACVGAGVELAAFARRVVADPSAFFALPELAMGLIPGAGGTVSIPRRIGRQRAAWMALTGARVDAATALAWGLIDEIAPGGASGQAGECPAPSGPG